MPYSRHVGSRVSMIIECLKGGLLRVGADVTGLRDRCHPVVEGVAYYKIADGGYNQLKVTLPES